MNEEIQTPPDNVEPRPDELSSGVPAISSTPEDRQMGLFCHLGGALLGFLVPLIIWLIKKDQSRFIDDQGKEALNFQITMLIGHFVGGLTICFTFGGVNLLCYVLTLVFGIMGGVAANKGEVYRYPINIRFIK
jgi:uncharacterized Tic20 family protein